MNTAYNSGTTGADFCDCSIRGSDCSIREYRSIFSNFSTPKGSLLLQPLQDN